MKADKAVPTIGIDQEKNDGGNDGDVSHRSGNIFGENSHCAARPYAGQHDTPTIRACGGIFRHLHRALWTEDRHASSCRPQLNNLSGQASLTPMSRVETGRGVGPNLVTIPFRIEKPKSGLPLVQP